MRKLVLVLMLFVLHAQLIAQTRSITGKVTDANGAPSAGVSVQVKGANIGTTTSETGTFIINVPPSARSLVFSAVDMEMQEVVIGNQAIVNVTLKAIERNMQEVVVVGYQQRRKRDEAGAISSVRSREIENIPVVSLDKALQGKAAGVLVQSSNGIPGGSVNVRIRGTGSYSAGSQPLYIVDGVQINTRDDASFTQSNPLSFLNPNDIESIDILKDAGSAAIYGSSAANGVVIITTKKGRAGQTKFQFNTYHGTSSPLKKLDVTNSQEFFQLRSEAVGNFSNLPFNSLTVKRAVLVEMRIPGANTFNDAQADSAVAALQTYDWQDAAFRKGSVQNYELSASGGNDKTTFRISANYNQQSAIITKADFKRGGLNFSLTNRASDKLSFTTGLNLSSFHQNLPFVVEGSSLGNSAFAAAGILPFNRIYNDDGTFFGVPPNNLAGVLNQNIIAVNEFNSGYQRTNQAVGNISGEYKLLKWLSFRSFYALDYRLVQGKSFRDPRTPDGFNRKGLGSVQSNWNTNFMTNQLFLYNHEFGKNTIDGLVGYEYLKEDNESISASAEGFPTFQFTTLNTAATPLTAGEFFSGNRKQSVFGNFNYNYDSRYLVGFNVRYDGSSKFGENQRYGLFPGVKVGWNIDREAFMEDVDFISQLRVRASWGQLGNDRIGNFDSRGLFGGGAVYSGSSGISFTQLANPDLRWEAQETTNFGTDFGFFKNRIVGSFEVYNKISRDLLFRQSTTLVSGFENIQKNIGQFQNRGIELTLGGTPLKAKNENGVNWFVNFIFAKNDNKVKKLYDGLQELPGDNSIRVGFPVGAIFTQEYAGVNSATGRPMWYDSLGNITYQVQSRDRKVIGSTQAKYTGGLTNTVSFKRFTIDAFFQYEYGRLVNDGQINFLRENSGRINFIRDVYDNRWTTPGQITSYPRMNSNSSESKGSPPGTGSRNWFKGDYIRFKNLMLAYELPTNIARKARMNSVKFYVQGTNLFTYAPGVLSYDVEFLGAGTGIIPQSRNFTAGLQLGF